MTGYDSAGRAPTGLVERSRKSLSEVVRGPEFLTDLLQITKAVTASTVAWWVAVNVLDSPVPFLAPWTALLTVHATVYRSLARGAQTTVASAIGVGVSFLIGYFLGVNVWTFALALFVGLAGARISWIRDEGVAIATTAIFILGSGFSEQQPLLGNRLVEVCLGVAVGVAVNLLVVPPLRDQQASSYVDSINRRMGRVLTDMADELSSSWDTDRADAWVAETKGMSKELDSAWQTVRFARESATLNPRLRTPRTWQRANAEQGRRVGYHEILERVDEGISHLRHLARTLREATYDGGEWDANFRERWVDVIRDTGRAIADPDAEVEPIEDRLDELATSASDDDALPGRLWPIYGSLITSVRHMARIVDDVASAREAREASEDTA